MLCCHVVVVLLCCLWLCNCLVCRVAIFCVGDLFRCSVGLTCSGFVILVGRCVVSVFCCFVVLLFCC